MEERKRILLLGSGRTTGRLMKYILEEKDYALVVLTLDTESATQKISPKYVESKQAEIFHWDATAEDMQDLLSSQLTRCDIVISLVFRDMIPKIGKECIRAGKHLLTSNSIDPQIMALDTSAKENNVLLLMELGLHPGIDHLLIHCVMEQMREEKIAVDHITELGTSLPHPLNDNNPMRYKFCWSPLGLLDTAQRSATLLEKNKRVVYEGKTLYENMRYIELEDGSGVYEMIPKGNVNREDLQYYGVPPDSSITYTKGLLRRVGFSPTLALLLRMGLAQFVDYDFTGLTYAQYISNICDLPESPPKEALCLKYGLQEIDPRVMNLEWLGLFHTTPIPFQVQQKGVVLADLLGKKLKYEEGERDLAYMYVAIQGVDTQGNTRKRVMTLTHTGVYPQETAISSIVGLSLGVAATLILEGGVPHTGVCLPPYEEILKPMSTELVKRGVILRTIDL